MLYTNVDLYISLSDFLIEVILFLGKLLHKLKNLSQLLLVWKNPAQYTESKFRMSLSIQNAVKIPYLRYCHLNEWKVLKFEKNCVLILSVISFLCYRCLLLTVPLFYGIV